MAKPDTKFVPIQKFGLKGLQTFDDPQFIEDTALAGCMNIILDGNQMAPRKGTTLLYEKPAGESGTPEQLFHFVSGNGVEYLMAKFTKHWYVRDEANDDWFLVGTQGPTDALYTGATWHNVFYSSDMYSAGFGNNIAYFAPSDFSIPNQDRDLILQWNAGMAHLTSPANAGDTSITVDYVNQLTFQGVVGFSLGGDLVYGQSASYYVTNGTLTDGSDVISNIPTTSGIQTGVLVTDSQHLIPGGTRVTNILSATSVEISNTITAPPTTLFNSVGDISNGSNAVTNVCTSIGNGTATNGSPTIVVTISNTTTSGVGSAIAEGMYIGQGGGVSTGTTVSGVSFDALTQQYTVTMSGSYGGVTGGYQFIFVDPNSVVALNQTLQGTAIPVGAYVNGVNSNINAPGLEPIYTGFSMSANATATIASNSINFFSANPAVSLTFYENNVIALSSPLVNNYPVGTAIASAITNATATSGTLPEGNSVLIWLAHLVIANAESGDISFSESGDPTNWSAVTSGVASGIGGRVTDMQAFGQFFLAGSNDHLQVGQEIVNSAATSYGVFFTPYLSGQGMGPISPAGTIMYNNTYYYPTLNNGIMALTPNFTGTSSAAGVEVLTDVIQDLFLQFTFLNSCAFNRKLYWLVSAQVTPNSPLQNYWLVYDLIRKAFTVCQHPSIDAEVYLEQLCLLGTDGNVYQGEVDTYEDDIGGSSLAYSVEAYSKRFDLGDPSLPKEALYCMIQGRILTGTTVNVDVLYNEGGSLGKQTYQITGDTKNPYFTLPAFDANALHVMGNETLGDGSLAVGTYRVYIALDKDFKAHNYQLHFYTEKAGSYWTVGIVSPNVGLSTLPVELVISPN